MLHNLTCSGSVYCVCTSARSPAVVEIVRITSVSVEVFTVWIKALRCAVQQEAQTHWTVLWDAFKRLFLPHWLNSATKSAQARQSRTLECSTRWAIPAPRSLNPWTDHLVVRCWLVESAMLCPWFQLSKERNLPRLIAACIFRNPWACSITLFWGFIWNPPAFRCGPNMTVTLRAFRGVIFDVLIGWSWRWLTARKLLLIIHCIRRETAKGSELSSCVKVEVVVPGSPSLTVLTVSAFKERIFQPPG